MKSSATLRYGVFLLISDFIALVAAFVGAYVLRVSLDNRPLVFQVHSKTYLYIFLSLLPFWILIFAMLGLYSNEIQRKRFMEMGKLLIGSFIGMLFVLGYTYFANRPVFPARLVPVYGFILAFVFLTAFRNALRAVRNMLYRYNIGLSKILIVGNTEISEDLIRRFSQPESGYQVVGIVSNSGKKYTVPLFKTFSEACSKIGSNNIEVIVQTELFSDNSQNEEILDFTQHSHTAYKFVPGNSGLFAGKLEVELFLASVPVIAVHQTALLGWGRITKRLYDIIASALLLIITSPLFLLIAIAQKLSDRGPVFFRQTRLTRFNTEFKVYKFRSNRMAYNGLSPEQAFKKMGKPELIKIYRDNGDQILNDPRITRLGKFLRNTSLDELPQLINVLRGELSLVGPRALIPQEITAYEKNHTILSVKSGMTGLAQVSGRRSLSFEERRKLDIYYVQNWSFWLDMTILIKTIRAVTSRNGAI